MALSDVAREAIAQKQFYKFPQQFVLFLSSLTVKRRSRSLTILPNIAKPSTSMYAITPYDTTFMTAKSKSTKFPQHINLRISLPKRSKQSINDSVS